MTVSSVMTTRSPGSSAPARRPATPWSLTSLRMANERRVATPGGPDGGDAVGHRIGAEGEPADRVDVVADRLEGEVGHQQRAVGPAHRLLRVDEPAALAARLQREVPGADGVVEQVLDEFGVAHPAEPTGRFEPDPRCVGNSRSCSVVAMHTWGAVPPGPTGPGRGRAGAALPVRRRRPRPSSAPSGPTAGHGCTRCARSSTATGSTRCSSRRPRPATCAAIRATRCTPSHRRTTRTRST